MALAERLAALDEPVADQYLAGLWKDFARTEAFEALQMALEGIRSAAAPALLNPTSPPDVRAHAAGQVLAVERLRSTIKAAISFDPTKADYARSENPGDSVMATPDPFTIL